MTRLKLAVAVAALVASSSLAGVQPAAADIHVQAAGVGTGGSAVVTPGLSDVPQRHTTTLGFEAIGGGYFVPDVTGVVRWDCLRRESQADLPPAERHGFTLTTLERLQEPLFGLGADFDPSETAAAGVGMVVGRCTGWAELSPDEPLEITCPHMIAAYSRVGVSLHIAGACIVTWKAGIWAGDLTVHTTLVPTSSDNTTFDLAGVVFRFRA